MSTCSIQDHQKVLAKALAAMVNTFGTSHKVLRSDPTPFQVATQEARDALVATGWDSLIADHLVLAGVSQAEDAKPSTCMPEDM